MEQAMTHDNSMSPAFDPISYARLDVHRETRDWIDGCHADSDPSKQDVAFFVSKLLASLPSLKRLDNDGDRHTLVTEWVQEEITERRKRVETTGPHKCSDDDGWYLRVIVDGNRIHAIELDCPDEGLSMVDRLVEKLSRDPWEILGKPVTPR